MKCSAFLQHTLTSLLYTYRKCTFYPPSFVWAIRVHDGIAVPLEVFELATYKKLNPTGKVVVAPLFVEGLVLLFYSGLFFGSITYWSIRAGGGGIYIILPGLLTCSFPLLFSVHLLRRNYLRKRNLFSQFQNFDLDAALCACESDRDFIYTAIGHLYDSHQAFTNYVRGPLREELLGPLCHSVIPQKRLG